MKKVLSIILAFTFAVQPAYSVVQPAQPAKKGIITKAKEKWSAMREAIKRGNAVLKANWQCITTGKGEKCSPDRYLALQVIRNFVTGKTEAAREAFKKLVQAHKDCWIPILAMLVSMGVVTVGSLTHLVTGDVEAATGMAASTLPLAALVTLVPAVLTSEEGLKRAFSKKCLLVIGLDLPIIIALVWFLNRMTYKHLVSPEHINDKLEHGMTLLHNAVSRGDFDTVKELLEKGADPNIANDRGQTPLSIAYQGGFENIKNLLLEKVADPKKATYDLTGLNRAVDEGNKYMVELLLSKEADPNKQDKDDWTPLRKAANKGHRSIAELLLGKGADPNKQDKDGWTPLLEAASMGYVGVVELLLEKGADPNQQDKRGFTPLRKAAFKGDVNIANLLIRKGADLHVRDHDGNTPLHLAVSKEKPAMIDFLLEAEKDKDTTSLNIKNNKGQTPRDMTTNPDLQKKLDEAAQKWTGISPFYEEKK